MAYNSLWVNRQGAMMFIRINISIIILLIMFSGCWKTDSGFRNGDPDEKAFDTLRLKAGSLLNSHPDSTLLYADSAMRLLQQHAWNDTLRIALMQLKANAFINLGNGDSAKMNYENARSCAIFISDTMLQATIDLKLGTMMLDKGNLYASEKYLKEAVEIFEKGQNKEHKGEAYSLYGSLLSDRGDILKSQQYLFKAYACFEKEEQYSSISRINNNIASNYKAQGSMKEALIYYQKALESAIKAKDTLNISSTFNNIGIFYRTSFPDSSLHYYGKSLALIRPGKNKLMELITRYNVANVYFDQKEYENAKIEYLQLLEICRSEKNVGGIARIYISLAAYYSKKKQYPTAKKYLSDAISLSDSIGDRRINLYALNELNDLYIKTKDFKNAFDLTLIIKKMGDSTLVAEKQAAVHEIEILYESEKKDAENARLKYQVSNQQTTLRYRMLIIILFVLSTLLMLYLFCRLTRLYKQRSLAYHQLVSKFKQESELLSRLRGIRKSETNTDAEPETIDDSNRLLEKLIEYYVAEKPYLDPKLKVADVAEKLNCSQKVIATALKGYTDASFNSFTNRYRVDAAIAMMDNPKYANYKIEAIAKESGFGSKTNFYATFESCTGAKPTYYRSFKANQLEEDPGEE